MKTILYIINIAVFISFAHCSYAGVIGYAAGHPEDRDLDRFLPLIKYLNVKIGSDHTVVFDTHERIRAKLLKGEFNIAILSPLNYVETKRSDISNKVRLIAKLEKNNRAYYESSLVINRKYSGGSLSSFKILYPSSSSTSSYLYPVSMLREMNIDTNNMLKEEEPEGKYEILARISGGEKAVAGFSNATFDAAKRKGIRTSNLYKIKTSSQEIPYDAVVIYRGGSDQEKYESAIASLFIEESDDVVKTHLPRLRGITGLSYATDENYDSLRKRLAIANGGGAYKIGLSLSMQPDSLHKKKDYFRNLQLKLFSESGIFLSPQIYDKDDTDQLVGDLLSGNLDIGELPPVAAGKAILNGLVPLLTLVYDGDDHYDSIVIKSINNTKINSGPDLLNKIVALGGSGSASSYLYPLKYLYDQHNLYKSDFSVIENLSADEIITSVAIGESDAGVVARFRLDDALSRGHDYVEKVAVVPGIIIRIPNGAYVAGKLLSESKEKVRFLRGEIHKSSNVLADKLNPSLTIAADVDIRKMVDSYSWANPKDTRPLVLIIVAAFILVGCAIAFAFIYQPRSDN